MLDNMFCYWHVLLCFWSPVMPLPQQVKHAGHTVIFIKWFTVPSWVYTNNTLCSNAASVMVCSQTYVIGHRIVTLVCFSTKLQLFRHSWLLFFCRTLCIPQPKWTTLIKLNGETCFLLFQYVYFSIWNTYIYIGVYICLRCSVSTSAQSCE